MEQSKWPRLSSGRKLHFGQSIKSNRRPNDASRNREYLTPDEVERMIAAARRAGGRLTERALCSSWRPIGSFRASELIALRWDQIDIRAGTLHVVKLKHGSSSTHPLRARRREQGGATPYVFTSLHEGAMTRRTVDHVVSEAAKVAGVECPVHPHMLRHATSVYLANAGQDRRAIQIYIGHKNIWHTVRYAKLASRQFRDFRKD